jgi:hypothetical protein
MRGSSSNTRTSNNRKMIENTTLTAAVRFSRMSLQSIDQRVAEIREQGGHDERHQDRRQQPQQPAVTSSALRSHRR